jgi:hypothetical protein
MQFCYESSSVFRIFQAYPEVDFVCEGEYFCLNTQGIVVNNVLGHPNYVLHHFNLNWSLKLIALVIRQNANTPESAGFSSLPDICDLRDLKHYMYTENRRLKHPFAWPAFRHSMCPGVFPRVMTAEYEGR